MKRLTKLFPVILMSVPVAATAQIDDYSPYHALLAKQCGPKHLEWVSPADLDDLIGDFHDSLSPALQAKLDKANDDKVACKNVVMGATCGNVATLKAMTTAGLLTGFVKKVCALHMVCRSQSDCAQP